MQIKVIKGVAVIRCESPLIADAQSALDLMAAVRYEHQVSSIAISKAGIDESFFMLSTGLAGEILQKFVNYHVKLAIIGDFSNYTSKPLRDFIYESNKGSHIFFAASQEEALSKLSSAMPEG